MIAPTGKIQFGQMVSTERGELVTFCGIINAIETFIPPVYISPRVRYKAHFLNDAPIGSLGLSSETGWMTTELFLQVLMHFKNQVQTSKDLPILLLRDNHMNHTSLDAIIYAKDNGIILLSFPPHCSRRMQPLDIAVYGPFKSAMKVAFNNFISTYAGKAITIYDIPTLSKIAFKFSFTNRNINVGFQKSGIWPLNEIAFNDTDFDANYVTVQPENETVITNTTSANTSVSQIRESEQDILSPEHIKPLPKAQRKTEQNNRERGKSRIYTDSPEKNRIAKMDKIKKQKPIKIKKSTV